MKLYINLLLLIFFQFCYLEWPNHSQFIYEVTFEIFSKKESLLTNFTHPIILLGLCSQILVLLGVFIPNYNSKLNKIGVLALSTIVIFFTFIGILGMNFKIIISTLPFIILATFYFYKFK